MHSILITGVEKSGTTAVFAALADRYAESRVPFLEPAAADQSKVARVMLDGRFAAIVKIVLKADIDERVIQAADAILATVRDPRDVVVSWLPFKAVSNPRLAGNEALVGDLRRLFERKESGDERVDVEAVERLYAQHGIAMPTPESHAMSFERLRRLEETANCWVERFENLLAAGESSRELPEPLRFRLVPLTGDISVNQRSGRTGEWKKWFSDADVDRYFEALDPFVQRYGYEPWEAREAAPVRSEDYSGYLERAVRLQSGLTENARTWISSYAVQKSPLFGTLKSPGAYRDAAYLAKLRERAGIGNLAALGELGRAVEAGLVAPDDFISRNAAAIGRSLEGSADA